MLNTRVCSPNGEHMVCVGANAPDDHTEDRMYAQMSRVRDFDRWTRAANTDRYPPDPEYEPDARLHPGEDETEA